MSQKRFAQFTIVFTLLILACLVPALFSLSDETLVLINGTIIDGTGAPPINGSVIIINDGQISEMGFSENIDIPDSARIIDLEGKFILPGFFNAHIHRGHSRSNLKAWAREGVTSVRDLGATPRDNIFKFRDSVGKDPEYARLVAAGPMVTVPGGYPNVPWGAPSGLPVKSTSDARQKVIRLLENGADIIKVALESGRSFGIKIPVLSLEQASAIVDVAHSGGTLVSAHVLTSNDLELALDAGVDDIAHMVTDNPTDDLIHRVVKDDVVWVPTLELWFGVDPDLGQIAIRNLSRFVEAGGTVALGTDYEGYNSRFDLGMPIREIRWMKESGMTAMQIITAATQNAARVCNIGNKTGTLEEGKMADIIIVNGNPLENLDALLDVRMVIHNGSIIRDEH
ncbi:amidohydrolase family protein [Acidobacteriota bacterium]